MFKWDVYNRYLYEIEFCTEYKLIIIKFICYKGTGNKKKSIF